MPAPATKDDFLEVVRKSQQIDNDRLDTYLRSRQDNPLPAEPKKLAALLVREGLLTSFQAEQFLLGKHKGFTLGGYRVIERLGAGGGGTVYLAEHQVMKRRVALKILPTPHASDVAVLERFRREAQAAAALDHPNIVRAYDFRQEGQMHFLVMEYVNGPSLEDVLHQQGALPIPVACDYIRQAAIGLQHAHDNGLVHRDVKPANLLVDASGIVKVLDLGLARFTPQGQQSVTQQFDENTVMGTADYLAPEQAVSLHDVDARADVYSLGATFYALLAGEPPFSEGTVTQKLIWHQMRTPRPIRERRAEVPSDIAGIVAAMTAKKVNERIQSCAEVAALLEPWSTVSASEGLTQPRRTAPTGSTASWSNTRVTVPTVISRPAPSAETFTTAAREPTPEPDRPTVEARPRVVIVKDASANRLVGVMMLGAVMSGIVLLVAGVLAFLVWGPQPSTSSTVATSTTDSPEEQMARDAQVALDTSKPADQRVGAINALAGRRRRDLQPIFAKALQDDSAAVRVAAVSALGPLTDAGSADLLIGRLEDKETSVRLAAIRALLPLHTKAAVPGLIKAMSDNTTRLDAIAALAEVPDSRALPAYLSGLDAQDAALRRTCRQALLEVREEVVSPLEQLVKSGHVKGHLLPELRDIYNAPCPVMTWALIGPFPDNGKPHPPETRIDFNATYAGAGKEVKWQLGKRGDPAQSGRVRLDRQFFPIINVVAYGYAEIHSTADRDAELLLGSDDTIMVQVNGKQVFAFNQPRSWKPDQDRVKVRLNKGKNTLLVRCGNVTGEWMFSVAITGDASRYAFLPKR